MVDRAPAVRLLKEPTLRIRFLTRDQAAVLLRELPQHLRDTATFALSTGLRAANITGLCWDQVDLERKQAWVHPDQAKARRAIAVPLNDTVLKVLERQKGIHPVRVFTYEGESVKQVSTMAWYKALKRAGIEKFRWHDLRHTWVSWHVQDGTPLHVLQELGGWETAAMVRRYAHLAVSHLAPYASRTGLLIAADRIHGRERDRKSGHKLVTACWCLKTGPAVSSRNLGNLVVARGGIEPPTRGFSVRKIASSEGHLFFKALMRQGFPSIGFCHVLWAASHKRQRNCDQERVCSPRDFLNSHTTSELFSSPNASVFFAFVALEKLIAYMSEEPRWQHAVRSR